MTKAEIEEEVKTLEAENEKLKAAKKSKTESNRELADELKQLEAENEQLKKELHGKKQNASGGYQSSNRYVREEVADSVRDTTRTLSDQSSRIFRGVTLSFFEPLRVYAEAVSAFADEISYGAQSRGYKGAKEAPSRGSLAKDSSSKTAADRERTMEEDTNAYIDRSMSFSGDVFTGMAKSFNKMSELPSRTIDRFYEGYNNEG